MTEFVLHWIQALWQENLKSRGEEAVNVLLDRAERYIHQPTIATLAQATWSSPAVRARVPTTREFTPNTMLLGLELTRSIHNMVVAGITPAPVTCALITAMAAAHVKPDKWSTATVALNPYMLLAHGQVHRMCSAVLVHDNTDHVLSNAITLLSFGTPLEHSVGSVRYAVDVVALTVLSGLLYAGSAWVQARMGWGAHAYYLEGLVGSSNVAYGIMVVQGYVQPRTCSIYGCTIPAQYACWVSLAITAWLVPRASLRGHVCGIVSGLLLVYVPHAVAHVCASWGWHAPRRWLSQPPARRHVLQQPRSQRSGGTPMHMESTGSTGSSVVSRYWRAIGYVSAPAWSDLLVHAGLGAVVIGSLVFARRGWR